MKHLVCLHILFVLGLAPVHAQQTIVLSPTNAAWRYLADGSDPGASWKNPGFNDAAWPAGPAKLGFGGDGEVTVVGNATNHFFTFYFRRTFQVTNAAQVSNLVARVLVDDGCVVYLNGAELLRRNMPAGPPPRDTLAASTIPDADENSFFPYAVNAALLVEGANVLAAEVHQGSTNSLDVGFDLELFSTANPCFLSASPVITFVFPSPGREVTRLSCIDVEFNKPVTNADAADLLVNGQPATNVIRRAASQYHFCFPEPPTGTVQFAWAPGHGIADAACPGNVFGGGGWAVIDLMDTDRDGMADFWENNFGLDPANLANALADPDGDGRPNLLEYRDGTDPRNAASFRQGPVVINEWMAKNMRTIADPLDGSYSDWFELFNRSGATVDLSHYILANGADLSDPIFIPAGTVLAPFGHLVVWADGTNASGAEGLHVDFQIAASGESIGLFAPDGTTSDFITFGPQSADISQGRYPNGGTNIVFMNLPTPGRTNITNSLAPPLRVTEIMYHPQPAPVGNTNIADNFEFIEVRNISSASLAITGFRLRGGVDFVFPTAVLAPGERAVIVRHVVAFQSRYGTSARVLGAFTGDLDDRGEHLRLEGSLGETILDFDYDDDWYPITDGAGFSLVIVDDQAPAGTWGFKSSWRSGSAWGGTPGALEAPPFIIPPVLVNEALTHTDLPLEDAIELRNPNAQPVDLSGWFLTDDHSVPRKFRIPDGTVIFPGGFRVFFEADFNAAPGASNSFALSSLGEEVYLFSADTNGNLTGYAHGFRFGAADEGVSFGRHMNSVGEEQFVAQTVNTLGEGAGQNVSVSTGSVVRLLVPSNGSLGMNWTLPAFDDSAWLGGTNGVGFDLPPTSFAQMIRTDITSYMFNVNASCYLRFPFVVSNPANLMNFRLRMQYDDGFVAWLNGVEVARRNAPATPNWNSAATVNRLNSDAVIPEDFDLSFFATGLQPGTNVLAIHGLNFSANNSDFVMLPVLEGSRPGGVPNAGPRVGPVVVSEIMYHPPDKADGTDDTDGEFIELHNITPSTVPLFDPANPTNTWRLGGAVDFAFAPGVTLPEGAYLLVVKFDPANPTLAAAFRARYGVPPTVPLHGPFTGKLDNSDERLELLKPGAPDTNGVPYIVVEAVHYRDSAPWPGAADGFGPSLQRGPLATYGNDPISWTASVPTPGASWPGGIPPVITAQPSSQTVIAGQSANFSVTATGSEPLRYQWHRNGQLLPGATSSVLALASVQPTNAGTYNVVVFNAAGAGVSADAVLTVLLPPRFLTLPLSQRICPGGTVTVSVTATGTPPLSFQWRRDGTNLPGATNSLLTITNFQAVNDGAYAVALTDFTGTILSFPARLTYVQSVSIVRPPVSQTNCAGSDATFEVTVTGTGPMGYRWRRNSSTVTNGIIVNTPTNSTLTLTNVQAADAGNYSVVVSNSCPMPGILRSFSLAVRPGPVITNQPQGTNVVVGGAATFGVGVSGNVIGYQWRFNGVDLPGATGPTLTIDPVTFDHAGSYDVIVLGLDCRAPSVPGPLGVFQPGIEFTCPDPLRIVAKNCDATIPNVAALVTVQANSWHPGPFSITQSPAAGTPASPGLHHIEIKICDKLGECVYCVVEFTVIDSGQPVLSTLHSGQNGNTLVPVGQPDPNVTAVSGNFANLPQAIVIISPPGSWLPNNQNSQWIGPAADAFGVPNTPGAVYHYSYCFSLPCTNQARLLGQFASDNQAVVFLNGVPVASSPNIGFTAWTPLSVWSGFIDGRNCLDFYVTNTEGPTGLRFELTNMVNCCTSCPPTWDCAQPVTGSATAWDVAVDADGASYVAGTFDGTVTLGSQTLISAGGTDAFIAKYDPACGLVWATSIGGAGNDEATGIAVDQQGNVWVAGSFEGAVWIEEADSFGSFCASSLGGKDLFVAKLAASTGMRHGISSGGSLRDDDEAHVAVAPDGTAYICGTVRGPALFWPTPAVWPVNLVSDVVVARVDSVGNFGWVKLGLATVSARAHGIAVSGAGEVVVTGPFNGGHISFGKYSKLYRPNLLTGVFLAKFKPNGNVSWLRQSLDTGTHDSTGVTFDTFGNVFVTGYFCGKLDWTGFPGPSADRPNNNCEYNSYFVTKYAPNGEGVWTVNEGGPWDDETRDIAVDSEGNAYVTGFLGGANAADNNGPDVFVNKYSAGGVREWQRLAHSVDAVGLGIAIDSADCARVVGRFKGQLAFGDSAGTISGLNHPNNAFLAKLCPCRPCRPCALDFGSLTNRLVATDDQASVEVPFCWTNQICFCGQKYSSVWINNNGNVTFGGPLSAFTPAQLDSAGRPIIAPFWADVDTQPAGQNGDVRWGCVQHWVEGVGLRPALAVVWDNVGYYNAHPDKRNTFELLLIDRSDRAPCDFDFKFCYHQIRWETGDASFGQNGMDGTSARAGFGANSSCWYEIAGAGVNGAYLDLLPIGAINPNGLIHRSLGSAIPGVYCFEVHDCEPRIAGTGRSNRPPVLPPISNKIVTLGQTLSFTVAASDPNAPPQMLTFSLDPGAPAGASIAAASGLFSWTPLTSQTGLHSITVRVTDDGVPSLSTTRTFNVMVIQPPRVNFGGRAGNTVTLTFGAEPGSSYRVEYKNALGDAPWTKLADNLSSTTSAVMTVTDTGASGPQRFYRVVKLD